MSNWEKPFWDWWTSYDGYPEMACERIAEDLNIWEADLPLLKAWFEVAFRSGFDAAANWPLPATPDAKDAA